ncbi:hypothetical protein TSUD_329220 [Trifolium subterraneum]|uniref:AAA+ ATPase domain-containing protein n=1 Tax=Trifolium subterraneum TaxID=3900 RepID=A0A2Z6NMI8_TRISU|nr:hypothetical protein TSUD_329220 [Trifolium subterraneum]
MEFLTELSKEAISKLGELALESTVKQFEYVIHHKKIIANLKEEHNKLEGVKEALQAWVDTKRMNREGFDPNMLGLIAIAPGSRREFRCEGLEKIDGRVNVWLVENQVKVSLMQSGLHKVSLERRCQGVVDAIRVTQGQPGEAVLKVKSFILVTGKLKVQVGSTIGHASVTSDDSHDVVKLWDFGESGAVWVLMVFPLYHVKGQVIAKGFRTTHGHWLALMQVPSEENSWDDLVPSGEKSWDDLIPSEAAKGIEYITKLKEEKKEFQLISYYKAPPTLGSTFTEDIKSLESRKTIIKEVIEKLKDEKFKRISICGMGGVGKTTLAKELIKIVEKKLFDKVVMAVVSQNPDYKNIQSQVADCLGLSLKSESVEGRGREIIQRMKEIDDDGNTKVLVVLDDVWSELNFDLVGLPSRDNQKCSKILFTSRNEKECQKMGSQVSFHVSVLLENEAWYLFQEITGDVVYEPDIYPIARQVSRECGGLPLAIVIIGKMLQNEKNLTTWEDAFEQLKNCQSSSYSDVHKFVYSRIELSFKFLDSTEHKKFLMLCGLFPEDFDIPIESLLRHAMGLGLFKVASDPLKARNRVHSLVNDLKRCCLLLNSDVPGCVKMHDIVRDVVILVAYKTDHRFMVEYDMKRLKEERLNDINAISLIMDETIGLESNLDCPTLQLLQLRSKRKEPNQWPVHFFQGMKSLKVLSMQNLNMPKLSTFSQASISLHTLQVLSFAHSNIKELPIEIGNLGGLRLLDLTNCNDLNVISANVLIRLSRLEELYLRMDNFPWKKNDVAINELKKISHQLKVVEMKVRGTEVLFNDLDLYNLQKFWIYVDPYTYLQRSAYLESNLLQVSAIDYQSVNSILMISQLIKKCEILAIRKVKSLKNIMSHLLRDCPSPYLKDLRVDSCLDLEYLIDCIVYNNGLSHIQSLSLKNLQNFKEMCYTSNHPQVNGLMIEFLCLVELELKDLPIFIGFKKAINLKELNQVKRKRSSESELTKVEEGVLSFVPLSESDGQVFPNLKEIKIASLDQLTHVWSKAMHCVQGFQNLKSLTISSCHSLRHVFDPSIIGAITNIEKLEIQFCKLMEYLVSDDEDGEEGDHNNKEKTSSTSKRKINIEFGGSPLLQELYVKNSNLHKCLVIDDYLFPNLKSLIMRGFDKISALLSFSSMTSLEHLEKLYILECKNIYEIVSQKELEANGEKIFFPALQHLLLAKLPDLKVFFQGDYDYDIPLFTVEEDSEFNNSGQVELQKLETFRDIVDEELLGYIKRVTKLVIVNFHKLLTCIPSNMMNLFSYLKILEVHECECIEEIFESNQSMLQCELESLQLYSLPKLKHIWKNYDKILRFEYLCGIIIKQCNDLEYVLPDVGLVTSLPNLHYLHVYECEKMKEIIGNNCNPINCVQQKKIKFPKLFEMELFNLPSLKCFSHSCFPCYIEMPNFFLIRIKDCQQMKTFWYDGILYTPDLSFLFVDGNAFDKYEGLNEVILRRHIRGMNY